MLGGVEIPFSMGLKGHSDADVVVHAICDAMLGALSLGDIGTHFPNDDPAYKDAEGARILDEVNRLVRKNGYSVNNADCVVVAEEPKISPFFMEMKKILSGILEIDSGQVSVKATTHERIGPVGNGEAVASYAVVTLKKI